MNLIKAVFAVVLVATMAGAQATPGDKTPPTTPATSPAPASTPETKAPANAKSDGTTQTSTTAADTKASDRSTAYYHYTLAHMYEELVSIYQSTEFANKAIEEYKLAIESQSTERNYLEFAGRLRDEQRQ